MGEEQLVRNITRHKIHLQKISKRDIEQHIACKERGHGKPGDLNHGGRTLHDGT